MSTDLYVINLDREPEKFDLIKKEFHDFNVIRYSAYDARQHKCSGIMGLFNSFIGLFKELILKDIKYAIVLEDDVYKCSDFDQYWPKIKEFIETSDDYDFIKLDNFLHFDDTSVSNFNDLFFKIKKSRNLGFTIYNINFLKKNIEDLSKIRDNLDMTMTRNPKFIQLVPKTTLIKQYTNKYSNLSNCNVKGREKEYEKNNAFLLKWNQSLQ
jgi:GR25 family glycosyltransferase involved in LPS biosynthesis